MRFEKWQALGNDYMIVEREQLPFELTPARIRALCAPHFGVFADGVLLLSRSQDPEIVADLRIYNPDGSEAELSGNGAREAILYLRRRGWTDRDSFTIQTAAGPIRPEISGPDTCRVDMGRASLTSKDFPGGPTDGRGELSPAGAGARAWGFQHVSIGNPQCAIHVSDSAALEDLDLPAIGPAIEAHASFPNRTNVSWYTEIDGDPEIEGEPEIDSELEIDGEPEIDRGSSRSAMAGASRSAAPTRSTRIRARIFERGVGETLSSGTGATGAAIAHVLEGAGAAVARGAPSGVSDGAASWPATVTVVLDGGELQVEVGEDLQVHLTGWARPVFAGSLSEELLCELELLAQDE